MSDDVDRQMAKVHQEVATHNSKLAVKFSTDTREQLLNRVDALDRAVHALTFQVQHLEQKYNLLLSERFNTGSTVHGSNS